MNLTYNLDILSCILLFIMAYNLIDTIVCSHIYRYLSIDENQKEIISQINRNNDVATEMKEALNESFKNLKLLPDNLMIYATFMALGLFTIFNFPSEIISFALFLCYLISDMLSSVQRRFLKSLYSTVLTVKKF